jgi:carboxypeptidase C (cathepsin A)
VDNDATLLDVADLVFMDPVGTGFSRAARAGDEPRFYSTLGDFEATAEFVSAWCAQHHTGRSPLYLVGESFGTWRAAAVAERLGTRGEPVAGIVLISGGCPVGPLQPPEVRTALRIPGWALVALHHGRLAPEMSHNPDTLTEAARRWAVERYAPALARVAALSATNRDSVAADLARFVGLAPAGIDHATLTVTPRAYRESLLRERGATLNPFDLRSTGATPQPAREPIDRYLRVELEYATPLAYRDLEPDSATGPGELSVGQRWSYDSAPVTPEAMERAVAGEGPPGAQPWVLGALAVNKGLRVFVGAGRYDSLNSCWANEDLASRLPADAAGRIAFHCYESGHMICADDLARPQLARDLRAFIVARAPPSSTAPSGR